MNTQQPYGTPQAPRPDHPTSFPPPQPMKVAAAPSRPSHTEYPQHAQTPISNNADAAARGSQGPWSVPIPPQGAQQYVPPFQGGHSGGPMSPGGPGGAGFAGRPPYDQTPTPPAPREPRFSREQMVAALLAAAGIAVTLIGVVLLLAMAAREGFLTPPVRVGGGAVLVGALAAAAQWVRPRPGARIGSVALLTTAVAGAFFDVVAVTRIYDWIPLTAGLGLALVVAAAASFQALRWDEKWLFIAVTIGVAALAPYLTGGITATLVGFLAVLQIAGAIPEITKGWDETALARTIPVSFAGMFWVALEASSTRTLVFGASTIAAVGLLTAVQAGLTRRDAFGAPVALAASWIPLWVFAGFETGMRSALVASIMAVVALGGFAVLRTSGSTVRIATLVLAGVSAVIAGVSAAQADWFAMPFLVIAVVLMAVHARVPGPIVGGGAVIAFFLGFMAQGTVTAYVDFFYRSRVTDMTMQTLVTGLMFVAFAALTVPAVRGRKLDAKYAQFLLVVGGFAGIVGTATTMLSVFGKAPTGFFLVHLAITVMSLALAALVLTSGLSRPRHLTASMGWGLALVGCALVKLFIFDLQYMGSMTKAFTFMAAGLVLLAAGTKYARIYGEAAAERKRGEQAEPQEFGPHAPASF